MIALGDKKVTGVYIGDTPVTKIYKGEYVVWENAPKDLSDYIIERGNEECGNIVLWDKANSQKIMVSSDNIELFQGGNYEPIGIVVIASSDNVYGDGSGSMISLKFMDPDYPNDGSVEPVSILWGSTANTLSTTATSSDNAKTIYNQDIVNEKFQSFTPYDWKTSKTIENVSTTDNYPAGFCCWRYSTPGTNQGDWYMPSAGELSYIAEEFTSTSTMSPNFLNLYGKISEAVLALYNLGYSIKPLWGYRLHTTTEARYDQIYSSTLGVKTRAMSIFKKSDPGCYCLAFCKI